MTQAAGIAPAENTGTFSAERPKQSGAIASILWVIVAFEIVDRAIHYLFEIPALHAFEQSGKAGHTIFLLVAWGATRWNMFGTPARVFNILL